MDSKRKELKLYEVKFERELSGNNPLSIMNFNQTDNNLVINQSLKPVRIPTPPHPLDWSWVQIKKKHNIAPASDSDSLEIISMYGVEDPTIQKPEKQDTEPTLLKGIFGSIGMTGKNMPKQGASFIDRMRPNQDTERSFVMLDRASSRTSFTSLDLLDRPNAITTSPILFNSQLDFLQSELENALVDSKKLEVSTSTDPIIDSLVLSPTEQELSASSAQLHRDLMDFLGDDLGLNQESNSKCDISEPSGEEKSDKALDDSKPIAPELSIIQAVNEVPIAPAAFEPDELIKNPIPIQAAADSQGIVSVLEKESSTTYASTVNVLDSVIIKEQYFILENVEEPKEFNDSVDCNSSIFTDTDLPDDQLLIAESEIIFTHPIATCTSSETVVDKVNSQVEDTSDKIPKLPKNCNSNDKIPIQALIKIISDHYRKMLDSHVPLEQWLKNLSTDSWSMNTLRMMGYIILAGIGGYLAIKTAVSCIRASSARFQEAMAYQIVNTWY